MNEVKPHAVLKLTDVSYDKTRAVVNKFEIVGSLPEEYVKAMDPVTPAPVKKEAAAMPTSSGKKHLAINALNPYMGTWTVKAKLAVKGNIRTFRNARGESSVCTLEFCDAEGTAIQATLWKDAIAKYDSILEVGKVYYVSKGSLRPANKKYSSVNNEYEMSLDGRCEIELCADGDADVDKMQRAYDLCKIDQLARKIGGRGTVDILAVVTAVGDLGSIKRKSDGGELQRRDLTLLDETKRTVTCTLWNSLAVEQGESLKNMVAPVVAIRGVRVSDYNGVSVSTLARSELVLEPASADIAAKTAALRAWYDADGATAETVAAGEGLASARRAGDGSGRSLTERTTFNALQPAIVPAATEPPAIGVLGHSTIVLIKPDQAMYYASNPEEGNIKKVVPTAEGKWEDPATGKVYDECAYRYIVRMKMSDASGGGWINVFHEQAVEMLGIGAGELHELKTNNPAAYERKIKAAQFSSWNVMVKAKTEEYQGESRRRLTVMKCQKPDYAAESRNLLKLMGIAQPVA